MRRNLYDEDHERFRAGFRSFLLKAAKPYAQEWESAGQVSREFWRDAGASGFVGFEAPVAFGGLGMRDYRYNAVIAEEMAAGEIPGDGFVMNDILGPYLVDYCTDEQRARWLPGFTSGELIAAIAMSEPSAGSDLASIRTTARYDGDDVVINGSKTFVTNGERAGLVLVLTRTGEKDGRGMSLVAVESGTPGFERGRTLHKIGRKAQDTAELFFTDVRVPRANMLGTPGDAFGLTMRNLPRERLAIGVMGLAGARHALDVTLAYCKERQAFGTSLIGHQTVKHTLAELSIALDVATSHQDRCILALNEGDLTAEDAAAAKYWFTDLQWRVVDQCLQLFGGYGYMDEYPISRMWRDARVQRIYGGTNEIMKEIVGRGLARQ